MSDTGDRAAGALAQARAQGADALVVRSEENRRYLTGFAGSAGTVVITESGVDLLVDFRYIEQATARVRDARVTMYAREEYHDVLKAALARGGAKAPGFESEHESHAEWERLREKLAPDFEPVPVRKAVEALRQVKSAGEIDLIRRACAITEEALAAVLPQVRPGAVERDLALALEVEMRRRGADGTAFDFIVASGPHSAMPHAGAGEREVREGDFVTFDIGARFGGYCADLTRTVVVGRASDRQREIYGLVLAAEEAAVAAVRPGLKGSDLDGVARGMIEAAGHGEEFGHGLGHGVGLAVHEGPSISRASEDILAPGNVVTIEPGVYIAGWGGVRIEDTVRVGPDGPERLTTGSRELIIL